MSWNVQFAAANKEQAKRRAAEELGRQMLSGTGGKPNAHSRDFKQVLAAFEGAIDACEEGAITGSGYGSLSGTWADGDMTRITGCSKTINVQSTPFEPIQLASGQEPAAA